MANCGQKIRVQIKPTRFDTPVGDSALMEQSRKIRGVHIDPVKNTEAEEAFVKKATDFDEIYYATLLRITDWTTWNRDVLDEDSHPPVDSLRLAPVEFFERTPPVIGCHQVDKHDIHAAETTGRWPHSSDQHSMDADRSSG